MISCPPSLDDYYASIESNFDVTLGPDYGQLVVPNGNATAPVHRWFHLKEAFSCDLVRRVLKDLGGIDSDGLRVLDPFAGVGTTATSVLALVANGDLRYPSVYGIEVNPFLHLVSNAKLRAHLDERPEVLGCARQIAAASLQSREDHEPPNLSTFHDVRYFEPARLQELLRLRQAITHETHQGGDSLAMDLLIVALGSAVGTVANLRRDGRALRYTRPTSTIHPVDAFLERCERIEEDLPARRLRARGRIIRGDGVTMDQIDGRFKPFDLILFSPPYPNNIDYSEVYKLENWFFGFISDGVEFREQRLSTLHSHPSVSRPSRLPHTDLDGRENEGLERLVAPIIGALPNDRYRRGRQEVVKGYVLDMYRTLRSAKRRLRSGGYLVYVVGNSLHGRSDSQFVIAADLLIAASARLAGLDVERVDIARRLRRRCNTRFLRESVVFIRNPGSSSRQTRICA